MDRMTSRERMLAAMRRQEVDRVPVPQRFWPGNPIAEAFKWGSLEENIRWKRERGFDPFIGMPAPLWIDHVQKTAAHIVPRHWVENPPQEKYPILCSEWKSRDGVQTASLRMTPDYPFTEMELFSDYIDL
jgi:hypothetical protein